MKKPLLSLLILCFCFSGCVLQTRGSIESEQANVPAQRLNSALGLTGSESTETLKQMLQRSKQVTNVLKDALSTSETHDIQTQLNWLTGFAVLGLLACFVAMFVIGFNKLDIGLALGLGGSIFVLQGLSWAAAYRYEIAAGVFLMLLSAGVVYALRGRGGMKKLIDSGLAKRATAFVRKI